MPATEWLPIWVMWVTRYPRHTLALLLSLTFMAGAYSVAHFSIDTEMGNLIRQEAPWRDDYERLKEAFPTRHDRALVVVSGTSLEALQRATRTLAAALLDDGGFDDLFAPMADPFFDRHALLFLSVEQLETMADRLAAAQPLLGAIANGEGVAGVLEVISQAIDREHLSELPPLLEALSLSAENIAAGGSGEVAWRDRLFAGSDIARHYSVITFGKPINEAVDDQVFIERIRTVINTVEVPDDITVRLSGAIALSHEEVAAAQQGVRVAGIVSVVLLALILYIGVGSLRIILATATMLAVGVVWTAAWGLLAVGQFNPLSLIFAVVFFGLGVDFAIHFGLRFQEAVSNHATVEPALVDAADTVGGAILLCALTTAIGFLAFVPTAYQGVSQLGIIAAGGMLIAAFLTLTLLPALFSLLGRPSAPHRRPTLRTVLWAHWLLRARRPVLAVTAVLVLISMMLLPHLRFDHSVLALKNAKAESMQVLRELQQAGIANDYSISVLVEHADHIPQWVERLEALDTVAKVESPLDFVPDHQADKRLILDDIALMLGEALLQPPLESPGSRHPASLAEAMASLWHDLDAAPSAEPPVDAALQRLSAALKSVGSDPVTVAAWDAAVTGSLARELDWFRQALLAEEIDFDDLPDALKRSVRGDRGLWHLSVLPEQDISDTAALTRYVEAVKSVAPEATGRPVLEWELGELVRAAFYQALTLALVAVSAVLLLVLRDVRATLLVLLPLIVAAMFTVALQVALGLPLNMANILVLPLIFGLGVGNGIHMVQRYRRGQGLEAVMSSSTPRAVILSALTTIGAFAALSLSPHQGTASIGMLLSLAVILLLLTVIFLLPAFLVSFGTQQPGKPRDAGVP